MSGPEDETDYEVNGDPTSCVGEDDESGFDELADWPEWQAYLDDGFDDADSGDEDDDDGEAENGDGDEE